MSLVERALKKLQESGATGRPPVSESIPVPVGRITDVEHPRAAVKEAAAPAPRPRIHEPPARIVTIDREALRTMRLLPQPSLERRIASQYQQIKRPLISAALGQNASGVAHRHVIMLTSALPGEGKTFTSVNLALSMALEKDIEVLLVDADVAKPHVTQLFGLTGERGLLDLLADGNLHPDSLILRTDVPGLSILPAGKPIDTATELLASRRMQQVVTELEAPGRKRLVLFDSPPLLLSTESVALLNCVGQIAVVVRAESTPRRAVQDALEKIGQDRQINLILNQSSEAPEVGYYGYGSYGERPEERGAASTG